MDIKKVTGKLVVCVDGGDVERLDVIPLKDAKGIIMIMEDEKISPFPTNTYPWAQVGKIAESDILRNYIRSTV